MESISIDTVFSTMGNSLSLLHVNPFVCGTKSTQHKIIASTEHQFQITYLLFYLLQLFNEPYCYGKLYFVVSFQLQSVGMHFVGWCEKIHFRIPSGWMHLRIIIYFGKTSEFSIDRNAEERSSLVCVIMYYFCFLQILEFGFHSNRSFHSIEFELRKLTVNLYIE